jgi:transcriptional regulator with XRE-family HTH domain
MTATDILMRMDVTPGSMPAMREYVSEELRALFARRRLSASQVARELGWKQMYLSRRMTGATAFDVDDLDALASYLQVDVRELFPGRSVGGGDIKLRKCPQLGDDLPSCVTRLTSPESCSDAFSLSENGTLDTKYAAAA